MIQVGPPGHAAQQSWHHVSCSHVPPSHWTCTPTSSHDMCAAICCTTFEAAVSVAQLVGSTAGTLQVPCTIPPCCCTMPSHPCCTTGRCQTWSTFLAPQQQLQQSNGCCIQVKGMQTACAAIGPALTCRLKTMRALTASAARFTSLHLCTQCNASVTVLAAGDVWCLGQTTSLRSDSLLT
jgi:hypothetical protein